MSALPLRQCNRKTMHYACVWSWGWLLAPKGNLKAQDTGNVNENLETNIGFHFITRIQLGSECLNWYFTVCVLDAFALAKGYYIMSFKKNSSIK